MIGERKTKQLNDTYIEKQEVVAKIDVALKGHTSQRGLILDALKNVAK